MNILVVDDCSIITGSVKKILNKISRVDNIFEACNGVEALEVLNKNPDMKILIIDWNMPIMNGMEFIEKIKKIKEYKDIYIIMITSEGSKEKIIKAIKTGIDSYIMKPFTMKALQIKLIPIIEKLPK